MTLVVVRVVDSEIRFEKKLRGSCALEALHLSFASLDREIRVLSAIVVAQPAGPMSVAEGKDLQHRWTGAHHRSQLFG
jgi:hypothetical protein